MPPNMSINFPIISSSEVPASISPDSFNSSNIAPACFINSPGKANRSDPAFLILLVTCPRTSGSGTNVPSGFLNLIFRTSPGIGRGMGSLSKKLSPSSGLNSTPIPPPAKS